MYTPSLEKGKELAKRFALIPVYHKMPSDLMTTIHVLKALKNISKNTFLFESVESSKAWGRYSFLGYDPNLEITCLDGELRIKEGDKETHMSTSPQAYLKSVLEKYSTPSYEELPSFTSGLVGYFAYDFIKYKEPSLNTKQDISDVENFYDLDLMLFKKIIVFDHHKQALYIIINVDSKTFDSDYPKALEEIEKIKSHLFNFNSTKKTLGALTSDFRPLFNQDEYCEMVEKVKDYIYEGDIFQAVLSNRFEADFKGSLLNTYRCLRMSNPSPYMFYLSSDKNEIVGASPETLVKLEKETLYTFPLAGTRPRGKNHQEDLALKNELLNDEKELAEHNMLVDLGRNDLGKISQFGSVEVLDYKTVHFYSHVMHIGSTVSGKINKDLNGLDAIEAVLPAGTLSGAPKLRACKIISALEKNKRGVYGGAIGYLDFKGNMDTCIAIRLCFKKNDKVYVRSGAGIVADSVAKSEYQECLNKAKAVMEALVASKDLEITER